ncbi:MAG: hypothetical protein R6T83_01350 [Salinibacter sp.]
MKRLATAGVFALLAGAFGLLLLASVVFSCRQGGEPHEMGTEAHSPTEQYASASTPQTAPALRLSVEPPGASRASA